MTLLIEENLPITRPSASTSDTHFDSQENQEMRGDEKLSGQRREIMRVSELSNLVESDLEAGDITSLSEERRQYQENTDDTTIGLEQQTETAGIDRVRTPSKKVSG